MSVTNIRFKWLSPGACTLPWDPWDPWESITSRSKLIGVPLNKYMRLLLRRLYWHEIAQVKYISRFRLRLKLLSRIIFIP